MIIAFIFMVCIYSAQLNASRLITKKYIVQKQQDLLVNYFINQKDGVILYYLNDVVDGDDSFRQQMYKNKV